MDWNQQQQQQNYYQNATEMTAYSGYTDNNNNNNYYDNSGYQQQQQQQQQQQAYEYPSVQQFEQQFQQPNYNNNNNNNFFQAASVAVAPPAQQFEQHFQQPAPASYSTNNNNNFTYQQQPTVAAAAAQLSPIVPSFNQAVAAAAGVVTVAPRTVASPTGPKPPPPTTTTTTSSPPVFKRTPETAWDKFRRIIGFESKAAKARRLQEQKAERASGGFASIDDHLLTPEQLAQRFSSTHIDLNSPLNSRGLDSSKAAALSAEYGKNILNPPKTTPLFVIFLKQFFDPFMVLLEVAGILSFITYGLDTTQPLNMYCAIILFALSLGSSVASFRQQLVSTKVMDTFKKMLPPQCLLIRDGREIRLDASELVPGDLVIIRGGDKVPADLRIIQCSGLKVECAQITGESLPVSCNAKTADPKTPSNEAVNLCLSGSLAQEGSALGIVIRTGDRTVIGQIAGQASDTSERASTLQIELKRFVHFTGIVAFSTAAVFFAIGVGRQKGQKVLYLLVNGFLVTLVAVVPQGLPATVTTLLTIVAGRLAKKNVFVKKLNIVETLGSASMICSDKTGTLTQNVMTVVGVWSEGVFHTERFEEIVLHGRKSIDQRRNSLSKSNPGGGIGTLEARRQSIDQRRQSLGGVGSDNIVPMTPTNGAQHLYMSCCICNNAAFEGQEPPVDLISQHLIQERARNLQLRGNPSEIALLRWCESSLPSRSTRHSMEKVFEIPFNSDNKWHLVICAPRLRSNAAPPQAQREYTMFLKGAPERIVTYCTQYYGYQSQIMNVDEHFKQSFDAAYKYFGSQGQRVLAHSRRSFVAPVNMRFANDEGQMNFTLEGFTFIGLTAIADPPRAGVPEAVLKCQTAGIRVAMVTGDHRLTACAIARQVNILPPSSADMMEEIDPPPERCYGLSPCVARYYDQDWAAVVGTSVDGLTQADWDHLLTKTSLVFCRVTPNHKLMIVEQCQAHDEIVAVTGDGVNDSPALKRAHIGIAMGLNGSDVAKEASDVILMDDNFASIVMAIEQGRLVFDNLMKTIAYTVSHILPELIPVLLGLALGFPSALSTLEILSIDLGSELGPAISLAYEDKESDIMNHPPRNVKKDRLVSGAVLFHAYVTVGGIESLAGLCAYLLTYYSYGIYSSDLITLGDNFFGPAPADIWCLPHSSLRCFSLDEQYTIQKQAATAWYIQIVMGQFFHIWSVRGRRVSMFEQGMFANTVTLFGIVIEMAILIIQVYVPGVNAFFSSAAVGYIPWVVMIFNGIIIVVYNELRKKYFGAMPEDSKARKTFLW